MSKEAKEFIYKKYGKEPKERFDLSAWNFNEVAELMQAFADSQQPTEKKKCNHNFIKSGAYKGMKYCGKCDTYKPEGFKQSNN